MPTPDSDAARDARSRRTPRAPPAGSARGEAAAWRAAALAVLVLALLLRLWGLRRGLPEFLDEAIPFRFALRMWDRPDGAIDWNPHFFHYPSLTLYLNFALQRLQLMVGQWTGGLGSAADYLVRFATDPSPMVIPARTLTAAFDLLTVGAVLALGARMRAGAGVLAALLTACSPILIASAGSLHSDTFLATFVVAALERTLAWQARGGRGRLIAAAMLIGLAAGSKYPGAALLLPLLVAAWTRGGPRALGAWLGAAALAGAVFLATTPFALLDAPAFLGALRFLRGLAAEGHLGNYQRIGLPFLYERLRSSVGLLGIALLGASLVLLALAPRGPRSAASAEPDGRVATPRLLLWLTIAVLGLPAAFARVEAERYLVPILPLVALLIADAALGLIARLAPAWRRPAAVVVVAALTLPALGAGVRAARTDEDATRIAVRRWMERNVGTDQVVVQELYAAPLLDRASALRMRATPAFAAARPAVRRDYEARPWFASVELPLTVVGGRTVSVRTLDGRRVAVPIVEQVGDLNAQVYDPRLFAGVDLVVTSSAVRGRFEALPERYRAPLALYALLDSTASVALRVEPHGVRAGPTLIVYRVTDRTRAAIDARGPLPPWWWTEAVPASYVARLDSLLPPAARGQRAPVDARGEPTPWVASLRSLFDDRYRGFAERLALELLVQGRWSAARELARAVLWMVPESVTACLTGATAAERMDDWDDARRLVERTRAAVGARGMPPDLEAAYAAILAHEDEGATARRGGRAAARLSAPR